MTLQEAMINIKKHYELVFIVYAESNTMNDSSSWLDSKLHLYYKLGDTIVSESGYDDRKKAIGRLVIDIDKFFSRLARYKNVKIFFTNTVEGDRQIFDSSLFSNGKRNIRYLLSYKRGDEIYYFRDYSATIDGIIVIKFGYSSLSISIKSTPSQTAISVAMRSGNNPLMLDLCMDYKVSCANSYRGWDINDMSEQRQWFHLIWKGANTGMACSIVTRKDSNYPVFCLYGDKYMSLGTMNTGEELNKRLNGGYDTYFVYIRDLFQKYGITMDMLNGRGCTIKQVSKTDTFGYQYTFKVSDNRFITIQLIGGEFGENVIVRSISYHKIEDNILFYHPHEYDSFMYIGHNYCFKEEKKYNIALDPVTKLANDKFYVIVPGGDIEKSMSGAMCDNMFTAFRCQYCNLITSLEKEIDGGDMLVYDITQYINMRSSVKHDFKMNYKLSGNQLVINLLATKGTTLRMLYLKKQEEISAKEKEIDDLRKTILEEANSFGYVFPLQPNEMCIIREGDIVARYIESRKVIRLYIYENDMMKLLGQFPEINPPRDVSVKSIKKRLLDYYEDTTRYYLVSNIPKYFGISDSSCDIEIQCCDTIDDEMYFICTKSNIKFAFVIDLDTYQMRIDVANNVFAKIAMLDSNKTPIQI